ncbi:AMP-binding protein [Micromonospora chokoriensis]|uniref:AMP-binding protein n=1 Tax=Micromonospora chokoriensis TaxID=356851 RepID=UPI00068D1CBA|nr:AMP-binding protein [Micromonospora chokoriensis]
MGTQTIRTIAELLRRRASELPGHLGYRFLADGEDEQMLLTYAEADARAAGIAAALRDSGSAPGDRVLLLLPPGLDYVTAFFGCLYAGVIAVPVYPPDPFALERTLPRLAAVARDAGPAIALTTSPLLGFLDDVARLAPELGALRWIAVDETEADPAGDVFSDEPEATALLQYTSGSTSTPRGVMLSHANLLHNSGLIRGFFDTSEQDSGVSWLPPYHDMGLIGGLLQPLHAGATVTLMSPLHFLEEPMRWLRAVHKYGASISGGPNFAYELCVRKSDPAQVAQLDLSGWRVAFNGAEPIRPDTLRRFARTFAPAGFRAEAFLPCYGLAEATLIVSAARGAREVTADGLPAPLVSCGRPADDQRVAVVDPATAEPVPDGTVGEILVAGPSVAKGYWNQPDQTARVFGTGFLRTGDLGFLDGGELVVTGRLKDLLIVRGRNHYPQDIEHTVERTDPVVRPGCAAAFLVPGDDEDRLVVVLEARRGAAELDVGDLAGRIRRAIAEEHGVQVHTVALVRAGGLPKTSSGKIQRWRCRELFCDGELPELGRVSTSEDAATAPSVTAEEVLSAPAGERHGRLEAYLLGHMAQLGGVAPDDVERGEPLLNAGLDSLAVVQLKQRMAVELGVTLPLAPLLSGASLTQVAGLLAEQLDEPAARPAPTSAPVHDDDQEPTGPLAANQRWMWVLQHLEPASTVYTIAVALRLLSPVDPEVLRRALGVLVARHPILRTTFPRRGSTPVQVVHPTGSPAFREHDADGLTEAELADRLSDVAHTPFDLVAGPLLRADLFRRPGGDVLLLSMHHIIADFYAATILARELAQAYAAEQAGRPLALPAPRATYLDVVADQRAVLSDPESAGRLKDYWDDQVGAGVPGLSLPGSRRDGAGRGGSHTFVLSADLTRRLHERAATERVTLQVLLLAAYQTLLHGQSGKDDVAVGVSAAARTRLEFTDVVGCCTNPVMVRSRTTEREPFRDLLARTRTGVIDALEHQDYPMIVLAERHRTTHRGRLLFETMFTVNRSPDGDDLAPAISIGLGGVRRKLGPLEVETIALPPGEATRPLDLAMAEVGGVLHGLLRYGAGVLDDISAEAFAGRYTQVLELLAADADREVGELARGASRATPA